MSLCRASFRGCHKCTAKSHRSEGGQRRIGTGQTRVTQESSRSGPVAACAGPSTQDLNCCQKGLRDRNSPTCTLSQNGYGVQHSEAKRLGFRMPCQGKRTGQERRVHRAMGRSEVPPKRGGREAGPAPLLPWRKKKEHPKQKRLPPGSEKKGSFQPAPRKKDIPIRKRSSANTHQGNK